MTNCLTVGMHQPRGLPRGCRMNSRNCFHSLPSLDCSPRQIARPLSSSLTVNRTSCRRSLGWLVQSENAQSPMLVTLSPIVTLVKLAQPENAPPPMLVRGRPVIVLGMTTSPPEQMYIVMVIVPLLVVQV